ncbi:hypothetical protein YC2023_054431 [Brassica napus]
MLIKSKKKKINQWPREKEQGDGFLYSAKNPTLKTSNNDVRNRLSATTRRDPPILAFGHITAFLHLSNKLAEKGHEIVFLLPKKALDQVKLLNLYPNLITFHTQSRACGE